jgi:hypothetical protein
MKGYISNKGFKIIEGITIVLMVVGIIALMMSLHTLNEIQKDIKQYKEIRLTK